MLFVILPMSHQQLFDIFTPMLQKKLEPIIYYMQVLFLLPPFSSVYVTKAQHTAMSPSHLSSLSLSVKAKRLRQQHAQQVECLGTTRVTTRARGNQARVTRRVIGALPPAQGQSLEDMIDHDRHTIETWCQRGGIGSPSHVAGLAVVEILPNCHS